MNLLIMGPAGAGKGTMSERIVQRYNIPHISTGDMFRAEIGARTELGIEAQSYIDRGLLVPDDVTIAMVKNRLSQDDCKSGYLLDGFPRTLLQAKALKKLTEELGIPLQGIVVLSVEYNELLKRITGRRICSNCKAIYNVYYTPSKVDGVCDHCGGLLKQRSDDTEKQLKVRLISYDNQTVPVIDYFAEEGIIHEIDAGHPIDEVWASVQKELDTING